MGGRRGLMLEIVVSGHALAHQPILSVVTPALSIHEHR
jgi:hypothetical protein